MSFQDRIVKHIPTIADPRLFEHLEALRLVMQRDELMRSVEEHRQPRMIIEDDVWVHLLEKWLSDFKVAMVSDKRDGTKLLYFQLKLKSTYEFDRYASQLGFKNRRYFMKFLLDHDRRNNGWEKRD